MGPKLDIYQGELPRRVDQLTSQRAVENIQEKGGHIVIPYTKGVCERIKNICSKHGIIPVLGGRTIRKMLVAPPKTKITLRKEMK